MRKIIDAHMHIGDIFHENKNITFKTGIKKGGFDDPFTVVEESGYTKPLIAEKQEEQNKVIDAGQFRVWRGTLENTLSDMEFTGVVKCIALPCLPNTTFEEYLAASGLDDRVVPLTGADMTVSIPEMEKKLEKDIALGARGLKLHPIIQNVSLEDDRMAAAAEVFGKKGLPITIHVGIGSYYKPDSPWTKITNPLFGDPKYFCAFAKRFPNYKLVAAHSVWIAEDLAKNTDGCYNVYADTSFSPATAVRKAVEVMGRDKVLYGTDYPFSSMECCAKIIEDAFSEDPEMQADIFYNNAAKLFNL